MRVCLFNANNLSGKWEQVKRFSDDEKVDLIIVCETHYKVGNRIGDPILSLTKTIDNTIIGGRRANGGIAFFSPWKFVRDNCEIKYLDGNSNWAVIEIGSIVIAAGYFPPRRAFDQKFFEFMDKTLEINEGKQTIILGDFNARSRAIAQDTISNPRGNRLSEYLQDHPEITYIKPSIGLFTSFGGGNGLGRGITDMLFGVNDVEVTNLVIHTDKSLGGSDHRPLVFDVNNDLLETAVEKSFERIDIRKLVETDIQMKYQRILDENLEEIRQRLVQETVEEAWSEVKRWALDAANAACGRFKFSRWGREPALWDATLLNSLEHINRLEAERETLRQGRNIRLLRQSVRELKEAQKYHSQLLASRKKMLFEKAVDDLAHPQNAASLSRMVSGANKRRARKASALQTAKLDEYADHFGSTFGKQLRDAPPEEEIFFQAALPEIEIDLELVSKIVNEAPLGKCPGCDNIPGELYKYGGYAMKRVLQALFTKCYTSCSVPNDWKKALICPIFKNKGSDMDIKNYRPIALTCVARRLYERVILHDMSHHQTQLHDFQGGFRARRSTIDTAFVLDEIIRSNPGVYVAYLDLKAAYDLVDRRILWKRLRQKYGVETNTICRLKSLFEGVHSHVVLNGKMSETIHHNRGLLQGSSASPPLFNFFIDGLLEDLERHEKIATCGIRSNALLFADDSSIHARTENSLREMLNTCQEWAERVDMCFGPAKCIIVGPEIRGEKLTLHGDELTVATEATYLGFQMNAEGINWRESMNLRIKKAVDTASAFQTFGMNPTGWAPAASALVYKIFIRPKMEYGLAIRPMDPELLGNIANGQAKVMRKIFGAPKNTSIGAMQKILHIEPMQHRNDVLNVQQAARWHNSLDKSRPAVQVWWGKLHHARGSRLNPEWESSVSQTIRRNPLWSRIRKINHLFNRLTAPSVTGMQAELDAQKVLWPPGLQQKLKIEAIQSFKRGAVADAIKFEVGDKMQKACLPGVKRKQRVTILRWRLGLVCQHQVCAACGETLSRDHGVECAQIENILEEKFSGILREIVRGPGNIIDVILNFYRNDPIRKGYLDATEHLIACILEKCRGLQQLDNHYWRPPEEAAQAAIWRPGATHDAPVTEVANPAQTMARRAMAIQRNRTIGRPSRAFHRRTNDIPIQGSTRGNNEGERAGIG